MTPHEPRLRIDDRFTHIASMEGAHVLVGEDDSLVLDSPLVADVVLALECPRTALEAAERLASSHPPETVHYVLLRLLRSGVLAEVEEEEAPPPPGSTDGAAAETAGALAAVWDGRGDSGVVRVEAGALPALDVPLILTDDYLRPALAAGLDSAGSESAGPGSAGLMSGGPSARPVREVLLAAVHPRRVWLGPLIEEGSTACYRCLESRLRLNLLARAAVHRRDGGDSEVRRLGGAVPHQAFLRLGEALTKGSSGAFRGRLSVMDIAGGGEEAHAVARLPHCPRCGDPTMAPPGAAVRLTSRRRRSYATGGHRVATPEETLKRLSPLVSPLTGVIRHVRRVPVSGTDAVHVYTASHPRSCASPSLKTLRADRRDASGGKGTSDLDAKVSALCECVERFSAIGRGTEPVRTARRSALDGRSLAPNDLLLFSPGQFRERGRLNESTRGRFQWIPEPYVDEVIDWSPLRSLTTGELVWAPAAAIYLGWGGEGGRFCKGDSNGLASGNCLEEALLQGLLELAERDAVAIWWYNRLRRPGLDLDAVGDDRVEEARGVHAGLGRDLWVLDLTTDLDLPTYAAVSSRTGSSLPEPIFGFGTHLDPLIALLRAVAEVNQMIPTVLRSPAERRRQLLPDFADAVHWWEDATLEEHPYLVPDPLAPPRAPPTWSGGGEGDLRDDVRACVERARRVGCEVLAHDLSRRDVGFPVARVFVPGLRHFWRRLGQGRLYDVPVSSGWLTEPTPEAQMNPVSLFV